MGTLTVKSPRALNFHAGSPVKERKIEVLSDGEISLHIIYDDGTEFRLQTAHGSVHVAVNELLQIENVDNRVALNVIKPEPKQHNKRKKGEAV